MHRITNLYWTDNRAVGILSGDPVQGEMPKVTPQSPKTSKGERMKKVFTHRLAGLVLCAAALCTQPALAQNTAVPFPSKTITIVVPLPAGASTDLMARIIQPKLSSLLGQSVVVDNKVGAGGYIGSDFVANSPPDGHTILLHSFGALHAHIFTKGLRAMSRELAPVAMVAETPNLAVISTTLPHKTLKEFIDYARGNKGKLNSAFIPNTAISLDSLVFLRAIDVDLVTVPYNGAAPAYASLARGDTQFFMSTVGGAGPAVDAGHVRPLAVTSSRRVAQFPNVPTARELGFNFEATQIWALLVPVKTPPALIRVLNEKAAAAINDPEIRQRLEKMGYIVDPGQPEALAARLAADARTLERAASDANIVPQ